MNREQKANRTSTPTTGLAATLSSPRRSQGGSAPAPRRLRATLAVLTLAIAAFAVTAAPASAAPPTVTPPIVSAPSYTTAHVSSEVDPAGAFFAEYKFEVSTDGTTNWTPKASGFFSAKETLNAELTGLDGGTHYFVRLSATNFADPAVISAAPNPEFTTLTADATAVLSIDNASDVAYTTATAKGKVNRPTNSNNVACNFEYIADAQFTANQGASQPGFTGATPVGCEPESPVEATGNVPVEAKLTGLANDTTYHLRLAVSNAADADTKEAASTFKTLKVDPPSVISIEQRHRSRIHHRPGQRRRRTPGHQRRPTPSTSAAATSKPSATSSSTTTRRKTSSPAPSRSPARGESPIHAEGETERRNHPHRPRRTTDYHLRLSASNLGGSDDKEAAATFTTLAVDPPSVLAIGNATGIDQDSAKVSGEISRPDSPDPAFDVNCRFQYVTDEQFKATGFENPGEAICEPEAEPAENPIHTAGPSKVTGKLTNLENETTYHLRLIAYNAGGTDTKEAPATFTTTQNLPASAVVGPITEISGWGAKLSGEADTDGSPLFTYPIFELSTDEVNWTKFPSPDPGGGPKLTPVTPVIRHRPQRRDQILRSPQPYERE